MALLNTARRESEATLNGKFFRGVKKFVDRDEKSGIYFKALLKTNKKFDALRKQQNKFLNEISKDPKVDKVLNKMS